ncbi:MAG: outer membrane protein assembly factor BamB family protein [Verrucomicrobiia bacterium]|jgi:outer membrane protein assembly factor BamB
MNIKISLLALFTFVGAATAATAATAASTTDNWHQWRGPDHNGVSRSATPPTEWSEEKNVQWKTAVPGNGLSTPIIWGDKVFLLTAVNTGRIDPSLPRPEDQPKRAFGITHPNTTHTFVVLCLDRNTGQEIWRHEPTQLIPHEGHHKDNNFAPASPVTDGKRLYCWFGSSGLFCYDLNGKLLWERNLGKVRMGATLGEGTSPALYEDKLVIVRDNQRQSYIETLDAKTGKTLWKKNRDEQNTWATPAIVKHSGHTQVITPGSKMIRSYDLNTGDLIWQCGGLTANAIPCPLIEGDTVICMTGYKGHKAMAIKLDSKGDVTDSDQIVWTHTRGTPYIPSPLKYDGLIWFNQSNQSMWSCVDANTGEVYLDRERLPAVFNVYSSPVGADGRIYVTARNGITLVLKRDKELKILARNRLDDSINSSPALAGDQLFLRGRNFLYCLSNKGGNQKPKPIALEGVDITKLPKLTAKPVQSMKGPNAALLARIDAGPMPKDYPGGAGHQPWVEDWMKKFSEEQRGQLGKLWAEKRRTDPDMPNQGMSFIKILRHVRESGKKQPAKQQPAVSGTVRFKGKLPPRNGINMTPESARLYDKKPLDENILAGKSGGLANVFVYAKRGVERKEYPMPDKPALLDQAKSMFRPRIQGVRVGQNFIIRNSDPYIHNTRSLSLRNRAFNIGQPPKSTDRERIFKRAEGPIRLGCDFHKWMAAWIFVLDHPFFAVTDEKGNFEIKGLPPGEYTFEAWHEEFGNQRVTLKVAGSANLNFTFQPKDR